MESPFSDASHPALLIQGETEDGRGQTEKTADLAIWADTVLIAGFGDPVAADYAAYVRAGGRSGAVLLGDGQLRELAGAGAGLLRISDLPPADGERPIGIDRVTGLIVFITSQLTARNRRNLDQVLEIARRGHTRFVGVISTFRVHLGDSRAADVENYVLGRAGDRFPRVVVFRPGHVLSRQSPIACVLERLAPFYPLFPNRLSSCILDGDELFAAIEAERHDPEPSADVAGAWARRAERPDPPAFGRAVTLKNRAYTLLGANRAWRELLSCRRTRSSAARVATAASTVLSWLLLGQAITLVLTLLARRIVWLRQWNVQSLKPCSRPELISLCHRRNFDYVKIVGYNNGVNHFGHRYPRKTVVSTAGCRQMAQAGRSKLKADCGATVRSALDFLAQSDQELFVVPNYSYVCLGTAFFVPIHGSAVQFSTVADTICKVVLYDPDNDRIIRAARDDAAFGEHVYNMRSRMVVLRLYVLAKPKSKYFIHRETLNNPSAIDLLHALRDPAASNVEIRQSHAGSGKVTVARYYTNPDETSSPALELPRDALGRLWDRLEKNPITAYLMHAVGRRLVWHTELFLTPGELDLFWRTHSRLPLRKIQLRSLKSDGLPHSPCRDQDCVSADLFLFRRNKLRFLEYLHTTLPDVRTNPGKHSH